MNSTTKLHDPTEGSCPSIVIFDNRQVMVEVRASSFAFFSVGTEKKGFGSSPEEQKKRLTFNQQLYKSLLR